MKEGDLKDIFLTNGVHLLNLSGWTKYTEKTDFEKGFHSKYYKQDYLGREISIGVFYKLDNLQKIDHIAWGYRDEKDCSYNANVNDKGEIINILAGCPCIESDLQKNSIFKKHNHKYLPIFGFLFLVLVLAEVATLLSSNFGLMNFLRYYMVFFFLIFGFLKIINLKKFSMMFASYDLIAMRYPLWGKIYPFLEIGLGVLYLLFAHSLYLNLFTAGLMAITSVGIFRKLISGEKVSCACLGGFFNVPLSWITFFENFAMFIMALYMIF
jgi:hypothetical protein